MPWPSKTAGPDAGHGMPAAPFSPRARFRWDFVSFMVIRQPRVSKHTHADQPPLLVLLFKPIDSFIQIIPHHTTHARNSSVARPCSKFLEAHGLGYGAGAPRAGKAHGGGVCHQGVQMRGDYAVYAADHMPRDHWVVNGAELARSAPLQQPHSEGSEVQGLPSPKPSQARLSMLAWHAH